MLHLILVVITGRVNPIARGIIVLQGLLSGVRAVCRAFGSKFVILRDGGGASANRRSLRCHMFVRSFSSASSLNSGFVRKKRRGPNFPPGETHQDVLAPHYTSAIYCSGHNIN